MVSPVDKIGYDSFCHFKFGDLAINLLIDNDSFGDAVKAISRADRKGKHDSLEKHLLPRKETVHNFR